MHVVQALVSLNIGGSELVSIELAEHLVARGDRVTVIAADGPLGERARASGAAHLAWPIGRKRLGTLLYIRRLADWLRQERPDVVHVHSRLPAWIAWRALRRVPLAERPVLVTTMHGHYSVSRYSSVMARGRRTIAVSEHIRRYTLENYPKVAPEDVVTVHGGASREDFPWGHRSAPGWREGVEAEFPALAGRRWLCMPGRVTRWKGHVEFINLVARLARRHPDLHGVCVGGCRPGSRYQDELESLAQRSGVGERLTFTGNRLDMRDWMAESEMVFNLSNDPPEAFGRTVLEALCLGRPVVAWDQGGVAEILAEMFPAGAVPVLDERELARRAERFLAAPPVVEKSEAFGLVESMERTVAVYRAALEGGPV